MEQVFNDALCRIERFQITLSVACCCRRGREISHAESAVDVMLYGVILRYF